jgi:cell division protein FtsW (lipid II flippase)
MFHKLIIHLKHFDWIVFVPVILLIGFGLTVIYSVSLGGGDASFLNFKKQFIFAGIGLIFLFLISFIDFR